MTATTIAAAAPRGSWLSVFLIFLRLGMTSFGGPVAHLGYFRGEFVERRKWLDEAAYTDIIALCQFLPGPASSQVGITLGILRAGLPGGFAAWLGFTTPSALALIAFGYGVAWLGDITQAPWLHGLKIVAVAVVAQAVWSMARTLCPDRERASMAVGAALLVLALPNALGQIGAILLGAVIGWRLLPGATGASSSTIAVRIAKPLAIAALIAFAVLLAGLPLLAAASGDHTIALVDSFYRAGSLVFGGGHVVLPLLQQAVVPPGWIGNDAFLAGYGAAQAVPGPLFTFAAYLGTAMQPAPDGWLGGAVCLLAIYLPSFLLLIGVLPFWDALRRRDGVQAALKGVNAAVVGLLLAALYTPVWTSAILNPADFGVGIAAFLLLAFWRVPPWLVVVFGALAASALAPVI
ncbi:MAG TPA: chromate efflux transporter [Stellaceae bacterium]|jgi:chromate transporter|nr:chromate efflux transporter [Stellaceae bacterium]